MNSGSKVTERKTHMKPILMTKVKNAIKKKQAEECLYQFYLKNIKVNNEKRGCSGFIKNRETGSTVYINTESTGLSWMEPFMYRYANDSSDYTGYRNRYAKTFDELVDAIISLTAKRPEEWQPHEARI